TDPQVQHLKIARPAKHKRLGEVVVIGQAVELSRTPWSIRSATPDAGEHTEEILQSLGYADSEINELRAQKVV
ncbi:MAG: CoA transferase, partial [Acetobacteraceae bacterium]|nr:CoA transferase [Acetobacteraceae bacterium]